MMGIKKEPVMSYKPSDEQVGGTHYKGLRIEPFTFAMHNDWDAVAFTILKRLSRYDRKDQKQDVQKALHEVEIRINLNGPQCFPVLAGQKPIPMEHYIRENGFSNQHQLRALRALEVWVLYKETEENAVNILRGALNDLIVAYDAAP